MIYKTASKYLDSGPGSLRSRIYNSEKKDAGRVYALVSETLKYKHALAQVIESSGLLKAEKRLDHKVALVMVHDLLLGKRIECAKCPEKDAVLRHKTRLSAELVKYKLKHKLEPKLGPLSPVRWVRANYARFSAKELAKELTESGLELCKRWQDCTPTTFYADEHVPGLFAVHRDFPITSSHLYTQGSLIIQDRASCFPVAILEPLINGTYLDACAAPGNKTSQLAGLSKKVYAFEKDKKRAKTLVSMLARAKLSHRVDVHVQDFTSADPTEFDVDGIVVDPSCSGSGIFGRGEEEEMAPERLEKLAEFQYAIVVHALRFGAQTVVYSTCSVHAIENEEVVQRLLSTPEVALRYKLRPRSRVLPNWQRRGLKEYGEIGEACVRSVPVEDGGIGFFAACFERRAEEPADGEPQCKSSGASKHNGTEQVASEAKSNEIKSNEPKREPENKQPKRTKAQIVDQSITGEQPKTGTKRKTTGTEPEKRKDQSKGRPIRREKELKQKRKSTEHTRPLKKPRA